MGKSHIEGVLVRRGCIARYHNVMDKTFKG